MNLRPLERLNEVIAMTQRRKHARVDVNIPIVCTIENREEKIIISSLGNVRNLSLGGMRISLPVHLSTLHSEIVDYYLKLPKPFRKIKGNGNIRWAYWDEQDQCTNLGMEIAPLDQSQRLDLEAILSELGPENPGIKAN